MRPARSTTNWRASPSGAVRKTGLTAVATSTAAKRQRVVAIHDGGVGRRAGRDVDRLRCGSRRQRGAAHRDAAGRKRVGAGHERGERGGLGRVLHVIVGAGDVDGAVAAGRQRRDGDGKAAWWPWAAWNCRHRPRMRTRGHTPASTDTSVRTRTCRLPKPAWYRAVLTIVRRAPARSARLTWEMLRQCGARGGGSWRQCRAGRPARRTRCNGRRPQAPGTARLHSRNRNGRIWSGPARPASARAWSVPAPALWRVSLPAPWRPVAPA